MTSYILPILIIALLIYARLKNVNCYSSFALGAKKGFSLAFEIFPFIAAILIATTLFSASGLSGALTKLVSPVFNFLGVPSEVCELIMIKPFSGSGSTAVLANILKTYGADSYIARCACVIASSSETIFYMSAVYFSSVKIKKLGYAIPLSIFASLIGAVVGCLICRIC